jgi:hypothetical protein
LQKLFGNDVTIGNATLANADIARTSIHALDEQRARDRLIERPNE